MKKFLFVLFLSALVPFVANAQVDREVVKSVKIYFRQGSSAIDESYMGNGEVLRAFAAEVEKYYSDSTARFRHIRVLSSVSPEGSASVNERIAKQRAQAITSWVNRQIDANVGSSVISMGVDWALLAELVQNSESEVPYAAELLELLVDTQDGLSDEARFSQITRLQGGVPYRWIYKNLFPKMRYASARCEFWWEVEPHITLGDSPERFAAGGGAGVVPYTSNVDDGATPVVTSGSDWVTAMESGNGEIRFAVAPNDSIEPRTTKLAVECYGETQEIVVEQDGVDPTMRITSASPVNYPAEGGEDVITYETNVSDGPVPSVSCSEPWIESITPTENGIQYVVAPNPTQEERRATILVENYGEQHAVEVCQLGAPECKRPFYMSIKTNLLYDLAAIPNIGAEFYLGKNFSIAGNWHYAWWKSDPKTWYWRTYGGDLAVRYWMGKASRIKPLTGHHLGVYGQMITYDFELIDKGILADKWSWAAGVEYGYSLPIARRLNLDFTIGFGYHWGLFDEYLPIDGHYVWQATKRRRYIGPTKLEISLEWLIGCGNYNKDKKGRK